MTTEPSELRRLLDRFRNCDDPADVLFNALVTRLDALTEAKGAGRDETRAFKVGDEVEYFDGGMGTCEKAWIGRVGTVMRNDPDFDAVTFGGPWGRLSVSYFNLRHVEPAPLASGNLAAVTAERIDVHEAAARMAAGADDEADRLAVRDAHIDAVTAERDEARAKLAEVESSRDAHVKLARAASDASARLDSIRTKQEVELRELRAKLAEAVKERDELSKCHEAYTRDLRCAMDVRDADPPLSVAYMIAWLGGHRNALRERLTAAESALAGERGLQIRFDGPPGPLGPHFIEAESLDGKSVNCGEWVRDGADYLLVIRTLPVDARRRATTGGENIQRGGSESDDGKTLAACRSHGSEQSDEQAGRTPARAALSFEERVKAEVSMWTKVGTEPPSLGRFDLTVRRMLQAEDEVARLKKEANRG